MNFRRLGKYICAVSLAAAMSVTTMGATTISDVANSHWAYPAISDLEERGIMVLTSSGQFYPNQTMNYFEVADVLAKATGYVDVDIATDIDATFKEQIKTNYEKQKATLAEYAKKYSTWNSGYNQQIAYLLGRGYMKTSDLDKFITKSGKTETKNIVTKEQLSVYLVRMLGKEKTATSTYQKTTFADDSSLATENKPYVAYLNSVGIVKPDAAGKVNGTMKVTKALCAKMVSDALKINDTSKVGKVEQTTSNTTNNNGTNNNATNNNTTQQTATTGIYSVSRVLTKNSTEYYICLKNGEGKESYYSLKNTTKILDIDGSELAITKLVAGTSVEVTIELQGDTEYITSIKLTNASTSTNGSTPTDTTTPNNTVGTTVTSAGTLLSGVTNGIIRIALPDGTSKVYLVDDACTTILDGVAVGTSEKLGAGDTVVLTINNSIVTKIVATSGNGITNDTAVSNNITEGEVTAKKFAGNAYVFTLTKGNVEQQITVPSSAKVTRNNKNVSLSDIRIGDTVKLTRTSGKIDAVAATGTKTKVHGIIKGICVSSTSQIVVSVDNKEMTYTLANNAEVYDNNTNEYISVRNLHLGQEVTIMLESMEIISIDVDKTSTTYNLTGTITDIGKNYNYIEVLVDYDYVSGESKVYKRIEVTSDVVVKINGKTKYRSALEEDMDIVISYKYLDDTVPEKILVI